MSKYSSLTARCHHRVSATSNDQAQATLAAHSRTLTNHFLITFGRENWHDYIVSMTRALGLLGKVTCHNDIQKTLRGIEKSEDCIDCDTRHGVLTALLTGVLCSYNCPLSTLSAAAAGWLCSPWQEADDCWLCGPAAAAAAVPLSHSPMISSAAASPAGAQLHTTPARHRGNS